MGKVRNILGGVFVVLYLCHHVSYNYFVHTHHFYWGTVTHSHPALPFGDTAKHTHTHAQCNLIDLLSPQGFFNVEPSLLPIIAYVFLLASYIHIINNKGEFFYLSLKGRSPPVC